MEDIRKDARRVHRKTIRRNMDRKIFKKLIIAAILACTVPATGNAQEYISTPVTVSKEKVRVNGDICYSHVVKEKQTLFSIAKAYEVTVDDIYAYNPTLKESGLKKNSIILIPAKKEKTPAETATPVTESDVRLQDEPKVEVTEVQEEVKKTRQTEKKKKQTTHTVKWYEDLDVIAEKYGVTVEAIIKANNLSGRKLAKRQKLIIPEPGEMIEADGQEATESIPAGAETEETIKETPDSLNANSPETEPEWIFTPKEEVKATLILPMRTTTGNPSRNNMDFYSGVLLAVKDLAETGISTELNVYDSSDSNHPIVSEDLDGSDLVIGPVSSADLNKLLATESQIKAIISPLDPRAESLALTNSNFIQVPAPQTVQYQDLASWIKEDTAPGDTLLIISEKGARQTDATSQLTLAAESTGLTFIPFSYSILEGRDITEPLTNLMTKTGTNRVLIASESEAFVNDVVRNLNILVYNKINIVLYAPARIRNFETIEVENLHNTALHASLGYLIDYEDQQVKNFLLKYRALYNTEPTQYAFQGYDIATYFISMCSRYGSDWMRKLDGSEQHMLQSTFRFVPMPEGGFVNQGIRRVVYGNGWSVTKTR